VHESKICKDIWKFVMPLYTPLVKGTITTGYQERGIPIFPSFFFALVSPFSSANLLGEEKAD